MRLSHITCGVFHPPARAPHEHIRRCDVVQQHGAVAGAGGRHSDIQDSTAGFKRFRKGDVAELRAKDGGKLADIKQASGGDKTGHLAPQRPLLIERLGKRRI